MFFSDYFSLIKKNGVYKTALISIPVLSIAFVFTLITSTLFIHVLNNIFIVFNIEKNIPIDFTTVLVFSFLMLLLKLIFFWK